MMWGMDYAPDETIWFTDEKYNSVWKFNIQDEEYQRTSFPSEANSYPQQLEIDGSKLIINDFKGNKLVFSDYLRYFEETSQFTLPDTRSYSYSIISNNPNAGSSAVVVSVDELSTSATEIETVAGRLILLVKSDIV